MDSDIKFVAVISGENPPLAIGEIRGICEAENCKLEILSVKNKFVLLRSDEKFGECISRAALTNEVYCEIYDEISAGKFRIESSNRTLIDKYANSLISKGFKVDLSRPDYVFFADTFEDLEFFGVRVFERNKHSFESRKVRFRPYCKPISVHPKLARAMVNLARTRRNSKFLDPFCGTGGILIEASLIGANVYGIDIDIDMVKGSLLNLNFYGLEAKIEWGDVSEAVKLGKFDAIATDPPYGRSSSSRKEKIYELYKRAFATFSEILTGYLCIILPDEKSIKLGEQYFKLKELYSQRVHKSLTRHICVYKS